MLLRRQKVIEMKWNVEKTSNAVQRMIIRFRTYQIENVYLERVEPSVFWYMDHGPRG